MPESERRRKLTNRERYEKLHDRLHRQNWPLTALSTDDLAFLAWWHGLRLDGETVEELTDWLETHYPNTR